MLHQVCILSEAVQVTSDMNSAQNSLHTSVKCSASSRAMASSALGATSIAKQVFEAEELNDEVTLTGDDDNHTMTGMMSATALNGGEEENEADEELEDAEDSHQGAGLGAETHT